MTVSFSEKQKTILFTKAAQEDYSMLWWSESDFLGIRARNAKIIRLVRGNQSFQRMDNIDNESSFVDSGCCCLRGLEGCGRQQSRERQNRIKDAVQLVIKQQAESTDDIFLASKYKEHTFESRSSARVRGIQDEEDAQQVTVAAWLNLVGEEAYREDALQEQTRYLFASRQRSPTNVLVPEREKSPRSMGLSLKISARRGATNAAA